MKAETSIKPKRHKKRKSRTEVSSESDSEPEKAAKIVKTQTSEPNNTQEPAPKSGKRRKEKPKVATAQSQAPPDPTEAINAAFKSYYMQHATTEFADDLNSIRGADDFRGEALDILVQFLQQGTDMFSVEEKKRVVGAGVKQP